MPRGEAAEDDTAVREVQDWVRNHLPPAPVTKDEALEKSFKGAVDEFFDLRLDLSDRLKELQTTRKRQRWASVGLGFSSLASGGSGTALGLNASSNLPVGVKVLLILVTVSAGFFAGRELRANPVDQLRRAQISELNYAELREEIQSYLRSKLPLVVAQFAADKPGTLDAVVKALLEYRRRRDLIALAAAGVSKGGARGARS